MDKNEVENMLAQVRTAHRLVAAYYQRLFPQLEKLFDGLGLDFYYWGNTEFSSSPRGNHNPLKRWGWDFIPGCNAFFTFLTPGVKGQSKGEARKGDFFVGLHLVTDSALESGSGRHKTEPDALNLDIPTGEAESYLRITVYKATSEEPVSWWHDIWKQTDWPELSAEPYPEVAEENVPCLFSGFDYSIADFIQTEGVEKLVGLVKAHQEALTTKYTAIYGSR